MDAPHVSNKNRTFQMTLFPAWDPAETQAWLRGEGPFSSFEEEEKNGTGQ